MTAAPVALVLRPLGLGDLLTGVPAIRALRRRHPDHRLLLAAGPELRPLLPHLRAVDGLLPAQPLAPLRGVDRPDIAVDLHGRGPASQRVLLAASPRRLIAFHSAAVPETAAMPAWKADEHEVVRWCRLLEESGIPADPAELDIDPPLTCGGAELRGCAVIHPGAAYPARRWPPQRFAEVARHCSSRGLRVVVTGTAREAQAASAVAGAAPGAMSLAGRTGLRELLDVVGHARVVISGDTGVAHIASATRRPSVLLFGPTPPAWWGPPAGRPQHRVLWFGRRGDPHGAQPDPGLLAIDVPQVTAAIDEVLEPHGPARSAAAA